MNSVYSPFYRERGIGTENERSAGLGSRETEIEHLEVQVERTHTIYLRLQLVTTNN